MSASSLNAFSSGGDFYGFMKHIVAQTVTNKGGGASGMGRWWWWWGGLPIITPGAGSRSTRRAECLIQPDEGESAPMYF